MSATEFLTILLNLWLAAVCIIEGSRVYAYVMTIISFIMVSIQLFFK